MLWTLSICYKSLPGPRAHDVPLVRVFSYFEPALTRASDYMEREAAKGKGAFIQALWTEYAKPKLYGLVYKAWRRHGAQTLTTWTLLAQAVLDGCFSRNGPIAYFKCQTRVQFARAPCTARKDALRPCISHTLPPTTPSTRETPILCRAPNPLRTPGTVTSSGRGMITDDQ
ncbi:hypothetical protein TNIN_84621 [Trichonephila inaurata madagascariensis]|uniref:Uncharacterized protein n=1 Tax=Trichonephila inaurata madagascariensis TaxID=2747483 RepID=A0A8X7CF06_9ARAC|nr:hypothetical protein TNIN_84621 [Trichonephila inaurata madagascariensis]